MNSRYLTLDRMRLLGTLGGVLYFSVLFAGTGSAGVDGWLRLGPYVLSLMAGPLFFAVSGAALVLKRPGLSGPGWLGWILIRRGVPLAAGTLVLWLMWQRAPYRELAAAQQGIQPSLAVGVHLWYFAVLLACGIFAEPLIRMLGKPEARQLLEGLTDNPLWLFSPVVDVWIADILLNPGTAWGTRAMGGWNLLVWLVFLLYGAAYFSNPEILYKMREQRHKALFIGVCAVGAIVWSAGADGVPYGFTRQYAILTLFRAAAAWCMTLAVAGYLHRPFPEWDKLVRSSRSLLTAFFWTYPLAMLAAGVNLPVAGLNSVVRFGIIFCAGASAGLVAMKLWPFVQKGCSRLVRF